MILATPVYRFFSKKKYAEDLVVKGIMRFTPISAFTDLEDMKYKDIGEKFYHFKEIIDRSQIINVKGKEVQVGAYMVHSKFRIIEDAWAFCGTTSIISTAAKPFPTYIKNFELLIQKIDSALQKKFNERLQILFGPVAYYGEREKDLLSEVNPPPYFSKDQKFKTDLEFRIVIVPSEKIYEKGNLESLIIELDNPFELFGETTFIVRK